MAGMTDLEYKIHEIADRIRELRTILGISVDEMAEKLGMRPDDVLIPFSSETKQGRDELWKVIDQAISEVNNE